MNDTRSKARGKWRGILMTLGLTRKQLSGNHQSCPMCGGTDRWRYSDHDGNGSYYCSGCGPGSGFDLLMGINGWDFRTAAKEVDKLIMAGDISNSPEPFKQEVDVELRRKNMNEMWLKSAPLPAKGAGPYISSRGLGRLLRTTPALFADIRFNPEIYLTDTREVHPGLVALVRNRKGRPICMHRTYFDPKKRKLMPPLEKINGSSIHLGPQDGKTLVVGEGIETTLSGCKVYGVSGRATISANMMEELYVPRNFEEVFILGDHDKSFTGQKAAFTLARRLDNEGRQVHVIIPDGQGMDFNDQPNPYDTLEFTNV